MKLLSKVLTGLKLFLYLPKVLNTVTTYIVSTQQVRRDERKKRERK